MNVFHIHGLAALDYQYRSITGDTVSVSGSLREKLSGLRHCFQIAQKAAPCILHIDFNGELSQFENEELSIDEENRVLSCIKEEIMASISLGSVSAMSFQPIVPIVLVLSTSEPIPDGPITSDFIHDSIKVAAPDEPYTSQLWDDDESFHLVKDLLRGKSVKEIMYLRKETWRKKSLAMDSSELEKQFSYCDAVMSIIENIKDSPVNFDNDGASNRHNALVPNVRWEDVGGLSHVRSEVMDAIELPLQYPHLFENGKRSGILLFGPPGSGKTLIAKAVATECDLPFLSVKGPELLGSYVGESEENVRATFASAREAALGSLKRGNPGASILFFDEIDSLAPRRGEIGAGGGVMERVTATLLSELDNDGSRISPKEAKLLGSETLSVFVVAATNRPDLLDPSLLRPGRFDRLVYLGLAESKESRANILAAQMRKFKFEANSTPHSIALKVIDSIPQTLTGADLSAVASGALMRALKRLCDKADEQLSKKKSMIQERISSCNLNLESIFSEWSEDELTPMVTTDDLIKAARDVVPSVSKKDLALYKDMKDKYCNLGGLLP